MQSWIPQTDRFSHIVRGCVFGGFSDSGCSGLVYLLFLCYFMFAERRGAMWETAYAAPAGRGKLACKRVVILAAASFCFVFLYSAVRLLFSLFLYGGLHPGVSIQEISDWQAVPLSFTMGTFILVQFLLRWMGL